MNHQKKTKKPKSKERVDYRGTVDILTLDPRTVEHVTQITAKSTRDCSNTQFI